MTRFAPTEGVLSWGRVIRETQDVARPLWREDLPGLLREDTAAGRSCLAIGARRSYGDSGLNGGQTVIDMTGLDRGIAFDPARRTMRAEAGMTFDALLPILLRSGHFLPVTPGTRFVTLGGAVANDVHGKNHHGAGTFGCWVRRLGLLRSDGVEWELTPDDPTGLFAATVGGLGLTGIITWVEFEVIPAGSALMDTETVPFDDLDGFFAIAAESEAGFDYTVAWVDCLATGASLGRGIFSRGRHAPTGTRLLADKTGPAVPFEFPELALNGLSVRAFNTLYNWRSRMKAGKAVVPALSFFYPLDALRHWNRIYGRRGMYQYQSVVPPSAAREATRAMLQTIAAAGQGSFLAVLKTFGDRVSPGLLSFPREGTTLALDFPNRGSDTLSLLDRLDAIVREAGGRLYPAKDGRLPPDLFRSGYPALGAFEHHVDPQFSSRFWRRMQAAA
ncbi:FAD-binding oxidoreductase [Lichenifustis flavocetrariae]|uniref:FAD-binding oxidoreductase n=1 Tax=Lichenifustis flavocetrariae TaxID=2949735 RepID=A0AA41YU13_9HYPH|nr:FAD-binding oxidoreductase [Lichenifustis flavocetrariae]MCW6508564.1 FAD-binding oxidoreductase [Lichenifustis flavocetrariae]